MSDSSLASEPLTHAGLTASYERSFRSFASFPLDCACWTITSALCSCETTGDAENGGERDDVETEVERVLESSQADRCGRETR
jgi:hypothetical protein